jgi:hypothetical protein
MKIMRVIDRINGLRKEKGVILSFLNSAIGGYKGKLTDVKNEKTTLTKIEIDIIAKALGTSSDYLLTGSEAKKSPAEAEENIQKDYNEFSEETREQLGIYMSLSKKATPDQLRTINRLMKDITGQNDE